MDLEFQVAGERLKITDGEGAGHVRRSKRVGIESATGRALVGAGQMHGSGGTAGLVRNGEDGGLGAAQDGRRGSVGSQEAGGQADAGKRYGAGTVHGVTSDGQRAGLGGDGG